MRVQGSAAQEYQHEVQKRIRSVLQQPDSARKKIDHLRNH